MTNEKTARTIDEIRTYKREWNRRKKHITAESLVNSETWKGRRAEIMALKLLPNSIDNNCGVMNKDFDILWNGLKIDVKSCNLYKRKMQRGRPVLNSSGWRVFDKNKGYSDYYLYFCMINNIPNKIYLIPKEDFHNGITVGQKSIKFDKYIIKNYE